MKQNGIFTSVSFIAEIEILMNTPGIVFKRERTGLRRNVGEKNDVS